MTIESVIGKEKAFHIHEKYGITTVQEAVKLTDEQLLKCRGVGKKSVWALHYAFFNNFCYDNPPIKIFQADKKYWSEPSVEKHLELTGYKLPEVSGFRMARKV